MPPVDGMVLVVDYGTGVGFGAFTALKKGSRFYKRRRQAAPN